MARYLFRFDAKGIELDHEPAPIAPPLQGAVTPEAVSTPRARMATPSRPEPLTMVNELKGWLEEHPDFGLDMDVLEEREVLITPPHWSYVSSAPALSGKEAMSLEDHRQAVQKYTHMLAERQPVLEEAIALAALASIGSRANDPAQKLQDALKALPKGGTMHAAALVESFPAELLHLLNKRLPPLLKQGKTREWADAVRNRHQEIVSSTPEPDWARLEAESWERWRERFQLYRRGRRNFDLDANDLLLRARWTGPAALFRNELGRMTLRRWTEALLISVRGTEEHSMYQIPKWVRDEVEKELVRGRKTLLVILGVSTTSPTAQWLPSKRNGCLWIERTRWLEYYSALRLGETDAFPDAVRWYVAVEVPGDPATLAEAVRQDVLGVFGSPPALPGGPEPIIAYLGKDKLPTHVTPVVPYLENVKGVDEAISKLDLLTRPGRAFQS